MLRGSTGLSLMVLRGLSGCLNALDIDLKSLNKAIIKKDIILIINELSSRKKLDKN